MTHWRQNSDPFLELGVPGLDPESLLAGDVQAVSPTEHVLFKPRWSAFYRTGLDEHLRRWRVDTVVIAGCNYPNCPRATIVDASERDYTVLVAADAISGVDARHLEEAGRIGVLHAETDEIVEALQPPELEVISRGAEPTSRPAAHPVCAVPHAPARSRRAPTRRAAIRPPRRVHHGGGP